MPHAERPRFPGPLWRRTRCPDTSSKATLWMKSQHEGVLTPPCNDRKNPQVPNTARQVACHSVNNSKGKRRSIPPQKTMRDTLVNNRQVACDRSQKWRGPLRFLPPFEMRPSSVAPDPAESRGAPPPPQDPSPLRGTLGSSLKSPAEGQGHEGFPPPPLERPRESFFNASRGPSPLP